eukprot:CAMPEP_0202918750 /NCGR_PEP_ID=MMETSP1392-20130828/74190_1 /ASSEMBLY_ACC=CAM_ASM_000868 /TAXON_ID=225041 /ORGANISM="Chlamydomonas chlamydogama, Strain SAG 11-48b" /LENGTH=84 /DNA_ID=CAMNT_0049611897 /DNA_START=616 /DNA_END=867 /DNA_ORIENTATION=-
MTSRPKGAGGAKGSTDSTAAEEGEVMTTARPMAAAAARALTCAWRGEGAAPRPSRPPPCRAPGPVLFHASISPCALATRSVLPW